MKPRVVFKAIIRNPKLIFLYPLLKLRLFILKDKQTALQQKRLLVCHLCPNIDYTGEHCAVSPKNKPCCKLCGCELKLKALYPQAECDIGRWKNL